MPAQAWYAGDVEATVPGHVQSCPNKEEGTLYKNLTLMFKPKNKNQTCLNMVNVELQYI